MSIFVLPTSCKKETDQTNQPVNKPTATDYKMHRIIEAFKSDLKSQLKESEEIMVAQSRQAAMGDMLSMIAHQWRQPLSVIAMAANNLKAQMELEVQISEENLHQIINTIDEQTSYLSHTIDDFRNFFKPDKVKEHISLNEMAMYALMVEELTSCQKSHPKVL